MVPPWCTTSYNFIIYIVRTSIYDLADILTKMLRRKARERREYLYRFLKSIILKSICLPLGIILIRKEVEAKHRAIQDKKDRVKNALASNR